MNGEHKATVLPDVLPPDKTDAKSCDFAWDLRGNYGFPKSK